MAQTRWDQMSVGDQEALQLMGGHEAVARAKLAPANRDDPTWKTLVAFIRHVQEETGFTMVPPAIVTRGLFAHIAPSPPEHLTEDQFRMLLAAEIEVVDHEVTKTRLNEALGHRLRIIDERKARNGG